MPRISERVVCTLRETIDTLDPTSAFNSVDLPALGAPIRATKPAVGLLWSGVSMVFLGPHPFTEEETARCGLFGDAF